MLQVFTGPFHPDLEDAFIGRLAELAALQAPVAVVAPSRRLAERLERLAAVEKGLPLLGVHFHTFHSLAMDVTEGSWGGARLVGDPVFHDRLVDSLLGREPGLGRLFGGEARPRALAAALRASLRDLGDAGVSAEDVQEFFGEELVARPEERVRLQALLRLLRAYEERLEELLLLSPSGLIRLAAGRAESCAALGGFREVLYYGFYDLTGLQLEFFEAVAARCETRLYFPFRRGHPAFRFAEPFFEQKLLGHGAREVPRPPQGRPALDRALDALFRPEAKPEPAGAGTLAVVSASGARDEAWAAAKEILRLVEREGRVYEDIGVAARSLEPYRGVIAEVFRENAIPFDMGAGEPLLRHPLAKCAWNLLCLRQKDFPAAAVLDIISSPYFRGPGGADAPVASWRRLIGRLGIHAGWLQWRGKLERRAGQALADDESRSLWDLVSGLARGLADEPGASWSRRARRASAFLESYLRLPEGADAREAAVWDAVQEQVASLAAFDLLQEPCDERLFLDSAAQKLRRASLEAPGGGRGVRVRDVMDARGERFKVLILLGLKEKLFPRAVLEDPLLRDGVRGALRHPAGYWIARKSAGYEEERLLFYLAAGSALERLVCVFPRSDEAGRAQVPSLYLRELCRAAGLDFSDPACVRHVPRQPAAKLEQLDGALASPGELSLRLALEGSTCAGRLPEDMLDARLLDEVLARASALAAWGRAGAFDGMVGPLAPSSRGLSPSALDSFAACPFQFFASRVLGLGEPDESAQLGEVPPVLRGRIYHELLERFFQGADASLWSSAEAWESRLRACLDEVFAERGWQELGVYPLLWHALRAAMAETLREFLAWDRAEALRTGLRPIRFEQSLEGEFGEPRPEALAGFRLHGIADRIDRAADGRWRVVDYKTRWSRPQGLSRLAREGKMHQLPVYAELAARLPGLGRLEEACLLVLEDSQETTGRPRCHAYPAAELEADRLAFLDQVAAKLAAMRAGRFPITPEDGEHGVCSRCAFPLVCRKSHGPSRARAAALPAD